MDALDSTPWRVVLHFVDDVRLNFNRTFDHLEPWQIVLYTLSWVLLVQWLRKILKFEERSSFKKMWYELLLNIPLYRKNLEENKESTRKEIEERLLRFDRRKEFYKFLPDRGLSVDEILHEAVDYKTMGNDMLFERGRLSGAQFTEDDENHLRLLLKMSELYLFTNASFPESFPACRKMEAEVIRMLCSLHHGGSKSCGVLTTSGTEAIVLACLAYRNWAAKRGIRKPEIIVGSHAHVAFARAAKLLGLRIVHVAVNRNLQADLGAIKRAISRETCMIVASAPNFVTGIMDNVEGVASLGVRFGIPVHVDATIGGFLLPFMEQCDYPPPTFDFRLSGVASISVDLHKYAYCPVGASAVLYRDEELLHAQCYSNVHWPGGIYMSQTLGGSRPGSLIAYTWATLLYNGKLGYVEKTQKILDAASTLRSRLGELEHLNVLGGAPGSDAERGCTMPVIAFTSSNPKIHIHALGDELNELGWNLNLLQNPNALRLCISLQQTKSDVIDEFVEDVKKCCEKILNNTEYTYASKTNVLFGLSTSFPDRGVAEHMAYMYADAYYSTPVMPHRSTRTLSIEGRKLSQINMGGIPGLAALQKKYGSGANGSDNLLPPPRE